MSDTAFLEELLTPLKIHFQNHEVRHIDLNEPGEYFVRFLDKRTEHHKDDTLTFEWGKKLIKHLCAYWRAPFDPESPKYGFVLPFGGRLHALFGNHCSTGMCLIFSAPSAGWPTPFRIEPIPNEMATPPDQQYIHHLIDALFQIRAQATNDCIPTGSRLDMLSGMATDIVFEILWSQAHWAIRNELGVPQGIIQGWTIDDERLHLIKWLRLFANTSFTFPNALPLQEIAEKGAGHLESVRLGNPHRYSESAEPGKWKQGDAKRTAIKQILEEMGTLIRAGIPERNVRKLVKDATQLIEKKFAKEITETLKIYQGNTKFSGIDRSVGGAIGVSRKAVPLIPEPHLIPKGDIRYRVFEILNEDSPQLSTITTDNIERIQVSIIHILEAAADFREITSQRKRCLPSDK